MWELYQTLTEGMDEKETVRDFLIGPRWSAVLSSSGSVGIAPVTVEKYDRFDVSYRPAVGMTLRDFASRLDSWNLMEASLALAAVNAYYNRPEALERAAAEGRRKQEFPGGRRARRVFRMFCEEQAAEGTTVLAEPVYHQKEIAELPGRMEVLRREPEGQEYVLSAYRERLSGADRLVLSGKNLVEKTAEPMLRFAAEHGTGVLLFGPDVPLCPALLEQGIRGIRGFVADRTEELMQLARAAMSRDGFLRLGHFVELG